MYMLSCILHILELAVQHKLRMESLKQQSLHQKDQLLKETQEKEIQTEPEISKYNRPFHLRY